MAFGENTINWLKQQGYNDEQISQIYEVGKANKAYKQARQEQELNITKELNALKKQAIDSGASGEQIEQIQNNYNIMRYGTDEQKQALQSQIEKQKILAAKQEIEKQNILENSTARARKFARNSENIPDVALGLTRNLGNFGSAVLRGAGAIGVPYASEAHKDFVEFQQDLDTAQKINNIKNGKNPNDMSIGYEVGKVGSDILMSPASYVNPSGNFLGRLLGYGAIGGADVGISSLGEGKSLQESADNAAIGVGLGMAGGALIEGLIKGGGAVYNKFKGDKTTSTVPNTPENSATSPENSATPNADDINFNFGKDDTATNGNWMSDGNTPPPNAPSGTTPPPNTKSPLQEQIELNAGVKKGNELVPNTPENSASGNGGGNGGGELPRKNILENLNSENSNDIVLDAVPDENGVYQVSFNGGSKELTQIASDINMGRASEGANRVRAIAQSRADNETKALVTAAQTKLIELKQNSLILYAENTKALNQIAKEYPNLNKNQHLEILNQRIAESLSDEIKVFTAALNDGALPSDARMWGLNLGKMVENSLNAGVNPRDIVAYLYNAGIKGKMATAIKAQIEGGGSAKIYEDSLLGSAMKQISDESAKINKAIYNEQVGAILDSAKTKAIENDKALPLVKTPKEVKDYTPEDTEYLVDKLFKKVLGDEKAKTGEAVEPKNSADEVGENVSENSRILDNEKVEKSVNEIIDEMIQTPQEKWSAEQKELFDNLPKFRQSQILNAPKIKEADETIGKVSYDELNSVAKSRVIDEWRKSDEAKALSAQYDKLNAAKYTAGEGGRYPKGAELAKITRAQNKIDAQKKASLEKFIKEYDEKVARNAGQNSRISGGKAGFSRPELPAGALGGVGGHMAGNAIGAAAGEYESEGGVAGAIIGALAGLASPKAAAKIAAKMMSKKANMLDLTKLSQQEKTLAIDAVLNTLKTKTPAKAQKMSLEEAKAKINALGFNADNLEAHIKDPSLHTAKDAEYRMSKFALVADTIKNFDIKATGDNIKAYIKFWQDEKGHTYAQVVTKENDSYIASYLPFTKSKDLRNTLSRAKYIEESPSHTENSKLGTDSVYKSQAANENYTPNELLSQGQVPAGWMKGATNISSGTKEQPKWGEKFKAKMAKAGQEYSDEKIANLANWHKDSHAVTKEADGSPKVFYHGTDAKFDAFDIDKSKGSWLGKSFYFTDKKAKAKGYGKNVIPLYLNIKNPYISKANDHYGFAREIKEQFGLKENYGEFDPALVLKEKGYDGVVYKDWNDDVGTIYTAFSPNQIKSIDNKGTFNPRSKMMRGYTTPAMTQALTNVMSGGVTGSINAANESDPDKKAEAFIKGFLLGFGGSAAASKLLSKNISKLAPQLARASGGFAKDLPNLLNDRPDILGGVLGKINNAKDNFKNIFGGEKAIGANKAKLKMAKEMAKKGENEIKIWAITGWYKDIDGKWKFEINPKGGELKTIENDPDFKKVFDPIKDKLDEPYTLKDIFEFRNKGVIELNERDIAFDIGYSRETSLGELVKLAGGSKVDEPMPLREWLHYYGEGYWANKINKVLKGDKPIFGEQSGYLDQILKDDELFKAYPQLKDVNVSVGDTLSREANGFYIPAQNKIVLGSHLSPTEMKSTLYHEIQHKIQDIEGFGSGADPKMVGVEYAFKTNGEVEARNVQTRLSDSVRTKTADSFSDDELRLLTNSDEAKKLLEIRQTFGDELSKAKNADERMAAVNKQRQAKASIDYDKLEADYKKYFGENSLETHPNKTTDVAASERIVSYENSVNANSVLDDGAKKILRQKASDTKDVFGSQGAKARLKLDEHIKKADEIAKSKGKNSPEYIKAKEFADDFKQMWFDKDGKPKLVASPCG